MSQREGQPAAEVAGGQVKPSPVETAGSEWPFVSVVTPVRNEGRRIGACLEALARTTYPHDRLEVLVMDAESEDGTRDVVQRFRSSGFPVRVLGNPRHTRGAALNGGIQAARGDIILCLDARNLCPPDYIERCVRTLIETGADNVGGVIQPVGDTPTQQAIGLAMSHPFGVGRAPFRLGNRRGDVASVYLGCFRRAVFDRVGLFDERPDISEDSDMNLRIRQSRGLVYLDPDIRMAYQGRATLRELWRLCWRYGVQRVGTLFKQRRLTAPRQAVPPLFVAALTLLGLLSLWEGRFLWAWLGLSGTYVLADLFVSARLGLDVGKVSVFPRLCLAFPCMHFAYALAFIGRLLWQPRSDRFLRA